MNRNDRNTKLIADGKTYMAVVVGEDEDGTAELTYQAGGEIRNVTAVLKNSAYHEKEGELSNSTE